MSKRKQRSFIVLASNKIHSALRPTAFLGSAVTSVGRFAEQPVIVNSLRRCSSL